MAKMALLIGVSDYEPGLPPLPGAAKDIEAMRRVLQDAEIGGFDDVKTLSNPDLQVMQETIETLFLGRTKGDLVLLFFSGHGIKDDNGRLHLATRITRKTQQGELIRATAVSASFIQDIMSNSRSKRQVVILDCCFSGAFAEGWLGKDDGSVDVKAQLGGEGRAVLTSSTSTQYSFEQEGVGLSTYSRYLVEGIETGAADLDSDGVVSIDELHEYVKGKVQEAAPAMKPEIYAVKEGYKIHLSQAPTVDPKLRYRKEVERCASRAVISAVSRYMLDELRETLRLPPEDAAAIEDQVLKPYQEYQRKLQRYEQVLVEAIQHETSLSNDTCNELKRLQRVLKLRDEDIAQIEAQITSQKKSIQPSGETAERIKARTLSRHADVEPVNLSNEAIVASQVKAATLPGINLPKLPVTSVPVLRNPKLIIGAGITTAIALTFLFLVLRPQPVQNVVPVSTASSTMSSATPLSAQDYYTKGNDKYNKQNYKGAFEDYTQAIQHNPSYADAYIGRGNTNALLKDYQLAIADYSQALKLNPKAADAYKNRGDAKTWLKDYQLAINDYNQALKLNPSYADAYYSRGNARTWLKEYQLAIADYQKAANLYKKQGKTSDYQDTWNQIKKLQKLLAS
jgi:uncharacterized caspase-like protein/tetratricopeptide (TPR) repeat protein